MGAVRQLRTFLEKFERASSTGSATFVPGK